MIEPKIVLSILCIVFAIGNSFLIYTLKKSNTYIKRLEVEIAKQREGKYEKR